MSNERDTPFANIDSAHHYLGLLCDALREARTDVGDDIRAASDEGAGRRREALQLVGYKLDRLEGHLDRARVLLNDLRMLRRLLLGEGTPTGSPPGRVK
jgi:hypothetical protein